MLVNRCFVIFVQFNGSYSLCLNSIFGGIEEFLRYTFFFLLSRIRKNPVIFTVCFLLENILVHIGLKPILVFTLDIVKNCSLCQFSSIHVLLGRFFNLLLRLWHRKEVREIPVVTRVTRTSVNILRNRESP